MKMTLRLIKLMVNEIDNMLEKAYMASSYLETRVILLE
jgi:hypothetical protein